MKDSKSKKRGNSHMKAGDSSEEVESGYNDEFDFYFFPDN